MAEARLLVGLGAGNMALCNAYVSQATTLAERTGAMANLAATGVRWLSSYLDVYFIIFYSLSKVIKFLAISLTHLQQLRLMVSL